MNLRKRSPIGWVVLAIATAVVVAVFWPMPPFELRVTEARVQAMLDARLPIVDGGEHHEYRIDSARVTLQDGRVKIDGTFSTQLLGRLADGTLEASSAITYHDGRVFFAGLQIDDVKLGALELASRDKAKLREHHLSVGDDAGDRRIATRALKHLLDFVLTTKPIYTLPDGLQLVVRFVRVEPGALVITCNPWTRIWYKLSGHHA